MLSNVLCYNTCRKALLPLGGAHLLHSCHEKQADWITSSLKVHQGLRFSPLTGFAIRIFDTCAAAFGKHYQNINLVLKVL